MIKYLNPKYSLYLFFFLLPYPQLFSMWAFVIFCIMSIVWFWNSPHELIFKRQVAWPFVLLFFIYCGSLFFTDKSHLSTGFSELGRIAPLLIVPFMFALNTQVLKLKLNRILQFFIAGNLSALLLSFLISLYRSINILTSFSFDSAVIKGVPFFESVTQGGNYFFSQELSNFQHPTYFSVSILIALGSIIYLKVENFLSLKAAIYSSLFFVTGLFFLSSRSAILAFILVTSFVLIKNHSFKWFALIISLVIAMVIFNPRIRNMVNYTENLKSLDANARYDFGLRLLTWDASIELIKLNWFFGTGIGDSQFELDEVYTEKNYKYPLQRSLNSHNQYLQTTVETGLVGFLVLLSVFYFGFKNSLSPPTSNFISVVMIIFAVDFFFESSLRRYHGIILTTVFYSMFWVVFLSRRNQ